MGGVQVPLQVPLPGRAAALAGPEPPFSPLQRITYVWREPRLCHGGAALPPQLIQPCRSVDFWLKVGISSGTCAAVLLAALAAYFWKKTQK